jgi:hypothetical protein
MLRPSESTARAVIYWAIALLWTLAIALIPFKDTTLVGGAIGVAVAVGVISGLYGLARKSIGSSSALSLMRRRT